MLLKYTLEIQAFHYYIFEHESIQMLRTCKKATNILLSSYEETVLMPGISDVIIVKWPDGQYRNTPFIICFGTISQFSREIHPILKINNRQVRLPPSLANNVKQLNNFKINKYGYVEPFHPSRSIIEAMNLQPGRNKMQWIQASDKNCEKGGRRQRQKRGIKCYKILSAQIYYFDIRDKLIISDVDGTMTKSDIFGLYHNFVGVNYLHDHYDVLIKKMVEHGYRIVWITMRSIAMYWMSKNYIMEHVGCEGILLPDPQEFSRALKQEVLKDTVNIKTNIIKKIRNLYPADINPFVGGLGNRENDAIAYLASSIPRSHIYIVDKKSQIHRMDEQGTLNYQQIVEEVDKHFPRLDRQASSPQKIKIYSVEKQWKTQTEINESDRRIKKKMSLSSSRKQLFGKDSSRPLTRIPQLKKFESLEEQLNVEEADSIKIEQVRKDKHKILNWGC